MGLLYGNGIVIINNILTVLSHLQRTFIATSLCDNHAKLITSRLCTYFTDKKTEPDLISFVHGGTLFTCKGQIS